MHSPEILAPAGNRPSFLAALAAGADAVYCGLKHFSARMEADNFSVSELAGLSRLARSRKVRVYLALNTMIKPDEADKVGRLLDRLKQQVGPDAVIFSDPGLVDIARQVGLECELHLSTLGNFHLAPGMAVLRRLGVSRVVLPRELSIDEIRQMAVPGGVGLEVFVHGALCYGISGRCYWSSFLGGKSGLRGRCVQPCRRVYSYRGSKGYFFSCRDLGLDVLAKTLLAIPEVAAWKIEGRKKGPHYVFYTVRAYQILRDRPDDARARKEAVSLLELALGREFTHYNFLPQRPYVPIDPKREPASGRFAGKTKGPAKEVCLSPRFELLSGDLLRVGYEGDSGHKMVKIRKNVPARGRFNLPRGCGSGLPVFLVDRREKELLEMMNSLDQQVREASPGSAASSFSYQEPPGAGPGSRAMILEVFRFPPARAGKSIALQLSLDPRLRNRLGSPRSNWYFLPPVIWPAQEQSWQELVGYLQAKGARRFVLGSPWQAVLFKPGKNLDLWAGPFCNAASQAQLKVLRDLGFRGAVLSPELSGQDLLGLGTKACIPVGAVTKGLWPVCVSRTFAGEARPIAVFESPKKEVFWTTDHDGNYYTFPNWEIDLTGHEQELRKAGFSLLLHFKEPVPRKMELKQRPGLWNWEQGLL